MKRLKQLKKAKQSGLRWIRKSKLATPFLKNHKKPPRGITYLPAPEIQKQIRVIVSDLGFSHISPSQIYCFKSYGASTRATARIWSFPRIWQLALSIAPHYIIEVISEHFEKLSSQNRTKVLIHELLHIPRGFSGALVPHRNRGTTINRRYVDQLFVKLQNARRKQL